MAEQDEPRPEPAKGAAHFVVDASPSPPDPNTEPDEESDTNEGDN